MRCVLCAVGVDNADSLCLWCIQEAVVAQEWRLLPGLRLQARAQVSVSSEGFVHRAAMAQSRIYQRSQCMVSRTSSHLA